MSIHMLRQLRGRMVPEVVERVVADLLLLNAAFLATVVLRFIWLFQSKAEAFTVSTYAQIMGGSYGLYRGSAAVLTAVCLLVFWTAGFYTYGRAYRSRYKILLIVGAVSLAYAAFTLIIAPLLSITPLPRSILFGAWFGSLTLLVTARIWSHLWKRTVRIETRRDPDLHPVLRNVLIIGGAGYIGSILVRGLLRRGYNVTVLDALLYGDEGIRTLYREPGFEFIKGDLRDIGAIVGAMQGIDAVVHLAALVGDPACDINERLTLEINLAATRMIADVAKGCGVRRFIFASTCSVYGASDSLLTEESPLNPMSVYARSKIASERALLALADVRFSPTILRFATVFGLSPRARFDLVVNILAAQAALEKRITIGGGRQWRPFIHVADTAESIIRSLEAPETAVKGEVFNVGSDQENYQIDQVAKFVRVVVPEVEVDTRDGDIDLRDYRVSFTKFQKHVGFLPRRTVHEGIREIVSAVRSGFITDYRNPRYSNYKTLSDETTLGVIQRDDPWPILYPIVRTEQKWFPSKKEGTGGR